MDRQFLIEEIRRIAEADGKAPGQERFRQETGVTVAQWRGVHFTTWSEALAEAGFQPNTLATAFDKTFLLQKLAQAVRALGKYPTHAELMMYARRTDGFPNAKAYQRHFAGVAAQASALAKFCADSNEFGDVIVLIPSAVQAKEHTETKPDRAVVKGFVYLMRSGRYHKIGRSNHVGRREYQIGLLLSEEITTIHSISTDDPEGIEAYWHNRFRQKRAGGEWFSLSPDDVKAFRLRRFQ